MEKVIVVGHFGSAEIGALAETALMQKEILSQGVVVVSNGDSLGIKDFAEHLCTLSVKEVRELANVISQEYGVEPCINEIVIAGRKEPLLFADVQKPVRSVNYHHDVSKRAQQNWNVRVGRFVSNKRGLQKRKVGF